MAVQWRVRLAALLLVACGCSVSESEGVVMGVVENSGVNHVIGQLSATGKDFNFTVCGNYFSIDSNATVSTRVDLDREAIVSVEGSDELQCLVRYQSIEGNHQHSTSVTIRVLDVNDEVPGFYGLNKSVHEETVSETLSRGSPIITLQPVDKDNGTNGTVFFNITGGNEDGVFKLDFPPVTSGSTSSTKHLYLMKDLDYETQPVYNLTISVSDMGEPVPLTSTQYIVILVSDLDDTAPVVVSMFEFLVREDHPVGNTFPIGNLTTVYQDDTVSFEIATTSSSIAMEFFTVNESTGQIFLQKELDYESTNTKFSFNVVVRSVASSLVTHATVNVEVENVNDESPYFVGAEGTPLTETTKPIIEETESESEPLITLDIEDNDSDPFGSIQSLTYTVVPETDVEYFEATLKVVGNGAFVLAQVWLKNSVDREEIPMFNISLTAYDSASPPNNSTIIIHIPVLDLNDNVPTFSDGDRYSSRIAEDSPLGKEVAKVQATDPDFEENGTVVYSIVTVDNSVAEGWFTIDSNGVVTVASAMDYGSLNAGKTSLVIAAHDNASTPQSSTVTLVVELSPGVTFGPRSFQEHTGYSILGPPSSIYLEFRTTEENGLLLYQSDQHNETFSLSVEDGQVNYKFGSVSQTHIEQVVSDDKWYSVLLVKGETLQLDVWETDRQDQRVTDILLSSTLARCSEDEGPVLYVGGLDLLSLPDTTTFIPGVLGAIKNLVVDGSQVDLGCPSSQENTAPGLVSTESDCPEECGEGSVCVRYAPEPYCSCLGGFSHEACSGEDGGYAPITFTGAETTALILDYSFFFDLLLHGELPSSAERRRSEPDEMMEVVRVSFRPTDLQSGLILYSRTPTSEHTLEINQLHARPEDHVVLYTVLDTVTNSESIRLTLNAELLPSHLYNVTITTSTTQVSLELDDQGSRISGWEGSPIRLLAQTPQTMLAVGGVNDPDVEGKDQFTGCISALSINSIGVPLSGLVRAGGTQFNTTGMVRDTCDLCTLLPCPENSHCESDVHGMTQECPCLEDYILSPNNTCVPANPQPSVMPGDLQDDSEDQFPFHYIVGVSVGGILLLGFVGVILILILRYRHRRSQQNKRTYHITGSPELGNGHVPGAKPNPYTNVVPRSSESFRRSRANSRSNTPGPPDCESVATYQQQEEDEDSKRASSISRRKSTSAETGFHTGSDRDERSIPRMEDSGNEKESDYSPFDSDSDRSTSCADEAIPPANIALRSSSENVMGVPTSPYRVPLTPKEKKAIEPLRPDSRLILSMSEFEDDTDTEFPFPPKLTLSKLARSPDRSSDTDSRPSNSPSWYKASTSSDTEREAKRAQGTCAYYPPYPHHPPFNKSKSMPTPPEYMPPPTITSHTSTSPKHFPTFYTPPPPEHLHLADSPLARLADSPLGRPANSPLGRLADSPLTRLAFKYNQRSMASPGAEPRQNMSPTAGYPPKPQHMRLHSVDSYTPMASSPRHYTYSSGFGGSEMGQPADQQGQFRDLKSMKSRINPIAYWEGQSRMRAVVDQVDPYQLLSEPYVQFEDVSTQTSVANTSMLTEETDGLAQQEFSKQGGREGTADVLDLSLTHLPHEDLDTLVSESMEGMPPIKHFPSADCSEEYTHTASLGTLVASSSDDSAPKRLVNGYSEPSSQFDV